MEDKPMIENVIIFAVEQTYDDGRPKKVWSIGDITKDGKIIISKSGIRQLHGGSFIKKQYLKSINKMIDDVIQPKTGQLRIF